MGSSRKVAGESGNKAERGQGAGERKEPPKAPDHTGNREPDGWNHVAQRMTAGALQSKMPSGAGKPGL